MDWGNAGQCRHAIAAWKGEQRSAACFWLNAPTPGWRTDTGRMAGYFVRLLAASLLRMSSTATN